MRRMLLAPALMLVALAAAHQGDPTVYKTKTGAKYHLVKCSSLRQSKIEIKLSEAKREGLTARKRCKPPAAN